MDVCYLPPTAELGLVYRDPPLSAELIHLSSHGHYARVTSVSPPGNSQPPLCAAIPLTGGLSPEPRTSGPPGNRSLSLS